AKLGERVTGAEYARATQTAHRLGRQMAAFHANYDVLLTPGLATPPPKLGWIDMMMADVHEYWRRVFHFSPFTVCFNLTGQPAIVLPLARSDATPERTATDLPVSVQFVARHGDEATLFRLAAQLEKARGWFVVTNAEQPALRLNPGRRAPAGDECARQRRVKEINRDGVVQHAAHTGWCYCPAVGATIPVEPFRDFRVALAKPARRHANP